MTPSCPSAQPGARGAAERPGPGARHPWLVPGVLAASFLPGAVPVAATLLRGPGTGVDLCVLHRVSGLWCPLCGGTRAVYSLLHGDVPTALGYNPFAPVVLALAVAVAVRWFLGWRAGDVRPLLTSRELAAGMCLMGVFGVLRNLPGMWTYLGPLLGPPG